MPFAPTLAQPGLKVWPPLRMAKRVCRKVTILRAMPTSMALLGAMMHAGLSQQSFDLYMNSQRISGSEKCLVSIFEILLKKTLIRAVLVERLI